MSFLIKKGIKSWLNDFKVLDRHITQALDENSVNEIINTLDGIVNSIKDKNLQSVKDNIEKIDKSFLNEFNARINDKSNCFKFPKKIKAGGKRTHRIRRRKY
jgi:hypothetical protein